MKHMSQPELATFFENCWDEKENHQSEENLAYSDPIEDAVLYKAYKELLNKHNCITEKTSILDIGCGSGRWIRYFNENFQPKSIHGVDLATSSVKLLKKWFKDDSRFSFTNANICNP
jgi:23S rRNA U2552 (ribose-2'-O)-methylase RlmE/FtsJ